MEMAPQMRVHLMTCVAVSLPFQILPNLKGRGIVLARWKNILVIESTTWSFSIHIFGRRAQNMNNASKPSTADPIAQDFRIDCGDIAYGIIFDK